MWIIELLVVLVFIFLGARLAVSASGLPVVWECWFWHWYSDLNRAIYPSTLS